MKIRVLIALLAVAVLSACGDDPFRIIWEEDPRESTLFALDRPELDRPTAFHLHDRVPVVVENVATQGRWDFVVNRQDGQLVLLPPRALGVTSEAGIVPMPDADWEDVREAPGDTARYSGADPVPAEVGNVYVVRTHRQPGRFGQSCVFYGKIQVVEADHEAGRLRFQHDRNPECGNRRLVPSN